MLVLADVGIAVSGTLVGALAIQTRARDLIVPILALPLHASRVVIARGARRPRRCWLEGGAEPLPGRWLGVLGALRSGLRALAYAVFDFLLED